MGREWDAEFELDASVAADLIAAQFPALAPVALQFLGAGYDNWAYLANEAWVFRFPRRRMGVDLIHMEIEGLPALNGALPLPISAPELIGTASPAFPYPFAGYRRIAGETADRLALSKEDRAKSAEPLAHFLKALHAVPIEATPGLPQDTIRRSDLEYRIPWLRERLARSIHLHDPASAQAVNRLLDHLAACPPLPERLTPVHGDLYSRHLIFNGSRLAGIIDWGDSHIGDPSLDLSIAYSFVPREARPQFWAEYGSVSETSRLRARFRAALYGVVLVEYGDDVADSAIASAGRLALEHAVELDLS